MRKYFQRSAFQVSSADAQKLLQVNFAAVTALVVLAAGCCLTMAVLDFDAYLPYGVILLGITGTLFFYNLILWHQNNSLDRPGASVPLTEIFRTVDISLRKIALKGFFLVDFALVGCAGWQPSVHIILAFEVVNILIMLCFLWYLLQPFGDSVATLSRVELQEHEVKIIPQPHKFYLCLSLLKIIVPIFSLLRLKKTRNKLKDFRNRVFHGSWHYLYELQLQRTLNEIFVQKRQEIYQGFKYFSSNADVISFLEYKRREIELNDQLSGLNFKMALHNKVHVLYIFGYVMVINYLTLVWGLSEGVLKFNGMNEGLFQPLYFLAVTVSTTGFGDISPANFAGTMFTLFIIVQMLVLITIIINIVNDLSTWAENRVYAPFVAYRKFLLEEINFLIFELKTRQLDSKIPERLTRQESNQTLVKILKAWQANRPQL